MHDYRDPAAHVALVFLAFFSLALVLVRVGVAQVLAFPEYETRAFSLDEGHHAERDAALFLDEEIFRA